MFKFIPKKVLDVNYDDIIVRCPRCYKLILRTKQYNYCSNCGQKLKYK